MWFFYLYPAPFTSDWSGIPLDSRTQIFCFLFLCLLTFAFPLRQLKKRRMSLFLGGIILILCLKIAGDLILLPTGFIQKIYPGKNKNIENQYVGSFKFPRKPYTYRDHVITASPHFLNDKRIIRKPVFSGYERKDFPYLVKVKGSILVPAKMDSLLLQCDVTSTISVQGKIITLGGDLSEKAGSPYFLIKSFSGNRREASFTLWQQRRGLEETRCRFWAGINGNPYRPLKAREGFPPGMEMNSLRASLTRKGTPFLDVLLQLSFFVWVGLFFYHAVRWNFLKPLWNRDRSFLFAALFMFLIILVYPVNRQTIRPGIFSSLFALILATSFLYALFRVRRKSLSFSKASGRVFRGLLWFLICWKGSQLFLSLYGHGAVLYDRGLDALGYETLAREIAFTDILNRSEVPFWHQPFYRWAVALFHILFGDSVVWVFIAQVMLYSITILVLFRLTSRMFSRGAGYLSMMLILFLFFGLKYFYWISSGYPCILGQLLLLAGICTLTGWIQRPEKKSRAFYAGLLLGWSIITRTNVVFILPGLIIWGLIFWLCSGRKKVILTGMVVLFLGAGMLLGLCGFRNWVLSEPHQFTLFIDSGNAANILKAAFPPPAGLSFEGIEDNAFYNSFNLSRPVRQMLETWRKRPLVTISYLVDRAFVILGLPPRFEEFNIRCYPGYNPWVLFTWLLAFSGLVLNYKKWREPEMSLILVILLMLFLSVAFFGLNTGNYRLVLPLYTLLLTFGASAMSYILHLITKRKVYNF